MDFIKANMPQCGDTVVVGLSGGVDSTLTAVLLKEKGCKVIGATMSLWDGRLPEGVKPEELPSSCYGPAEEKNIAECKKFCQEQGFEYYVVDVKKEYREEILNNYIEEYRKGRTPNPCVRCNWKIKFGAFLRGIEKLGIKYDFFCTGHYADIVQPAEGLFGSDSKPFMLAGAVDSTKDQTYFLYHLTSDILSKVRFPLAGIKKSEVFQMAKERNLVAANRQESQDFVPQQYVDMLFSDKPSVPGKIIDLDGKVLGTHRGIEHYTVGQRRGLGVAVNYPVYVQAIDAENNVVVLAKNEDLNSSALLAENFEWAGNIIPNESVKALVKIRFASRPTPAVIEKNDEDTWRITFETPQRAVAPGQSIVAYIDGVIVGGGIISKAIN